MVKHSRSGLLLMPGESQQPPPIAAGEATSEVEQEDDWGWFEDLDPVDEDDLRAAVAAAQHLEPSCRRHCPAPTTAAATSSDGTIGSITSKEEEVTIGDKPSVPVRPNDEDALHHQREAHAFKPQRSRPDELTHPPKLLVTSSSLDDNQTRSWVVVGGDGGAFKPQRSRSDGLAHPPKLLATGSFLDDDQTRSWIVVGGGGGAFAPATTRRMEDTAAAHPDDANAFCERALRVALERSGNSEATTIAVASDPVLTRHPLVCEAPAVERSAAVAIRGVGGDDGASGGGGPPAAIDAVCAFSCAGGPPSGVGCAASGGAAAGGSSAGNHLGGSATTFGTTTGSTTDDLLLFARDVARMRSRSRSRRAP